MARQFDARCVLERLATATGREESELLDELAAWAQSAGGRVEWQQKQQSGGRGGKNRSAAELVLLVSRDWFERAPS